MTIRKRHIVISALLLTSCAPAAQEASFHRGELIRQKAGEDYRLRIQADERAEQERLGYSLDLERFRTTTTRRASRSKPRGACSLDYIRAHENPHDPSGSPYGRSTNRTHFGAYQFDRGTWASNGGDPNTWGIATPEEQDRVAATTYARRGSQPWQVCH